MNLLTITNLTFREAWRKKIFWVALALGLAFIILFGIGFHFILQEALQTNPDRPRSLAANNVMRSQLSGVFLLLGLYAINFLIVMMSALTSAGAISGEISSHTIQTIATKPIRRWEIVAGKLLGQSIMLIFYVIFMAGGLILEVNLMTGYLPPNIVPGLALMMLEGLVVLSITTLGGTIFSTMANGVLVFMLYGIAFAGSWVEQIGAALDSATAVQVGVVAGLIMPSETLWRMASIQMQSRVISAVEFPLVTAYSQPSEAMSVYALLYIAILFGVAIRQFGKRDL